MANFEGLSDPGGMHGDGVNDGLYQPFYSRLDQYCSRILPGGWVNADIAETGDR